MKLKNILINPDDIFFVGKLWLFGKNDKLMGPGRVELLEKIQETGSINQAAKLMLMSYKKAWELVNSMNSQTIKPLIITRTGGKEGGGATITDEAKFLINIFKEAQKNFDQYLAEELKKLLHSENL
jgi:molybdate transport system regulatory protein